MSDDETFVRQRLLRLLARQQPGPPRPAAPPAHGGDPPGPLTAPLPLSVGEPPHGPLGVGEPSHGPLSVGEPPHGPEEPAGPVAPSRLPGPYAFDPGRRGVRALAAVAAVVVLAAAGWAWWSRPRPEPVAIESPAVTELAETAPDPAQVAPAVAASGAEVVVAVAGKVRRPGLVRLPPGARVADALDAAGGALPGVDVALLNLARKVTDGELILVGVTAPPGGQPGAQPGGAAPPGAAGTTKVNLNTATLAELDALPGVGPVLAQRILDHREQQGAFRAVNDLRQVNGIGDARYEELKDLVTV